MPERPPFATRADLETRHPGELAILAMDEQTRQVDPARVEAACADASHEIRAILGSRYTADDLGRLDPASASVLKLYAIDIALYRLALPPRQTEGMRERYLAAVARLSAIASGKGALTIVGAGGETGPATPGAPGPTGSPNEVLITANERLFTRDRYRGGSARRRGLG